MIAITGHMVGVGEELPFACRLMAEGRIQSQLQSSLENQKGVTM